MVIKNSLLTILIPNNLYLRPKNDIYDLWFKYYISSSGYILIIRSTKLLYCEKNKKLITLKIEEFL